MAADLTQLVTQTTMRLNASTMSLADEHSTLRGLEIFAVVLMSVIIIVAFQGNLFIILVIFINPQLRSSMANIFIINLCIVDLLASVLAIPLSLVTFVHGYDALKKEVCEMSGFSSTFVMVASMLSLCVISVDRFYSIALPMHHAGHATPCMYIFAVLLIWAIGLALALLPWIGVNSYSFRPAKRICSYYWQGGTSTDRAFIVTIFIVSFLLPSIILISMYIGIFRVARKAATSVGPHPSGVTFRAAEPEIGAQDIHLTTHNNSPADAIFTVPSPEKTCNTLPKINVERVVSGNSAELSRIRFINELSQSRDDSGIRTAEGTDAASVQAFPAYNNNVKDDENGCQKKPPAQSEDHQELSCSKLLCVCKRSDVHCIAGPSISNIKMSESNNGQTRMCTQTDEPQFNHIAKPHPNSHVISHDPVKVKASHMKAFKTLMIIVASYFVLWSPYFICLLYDLTHRDTASYAMELVATWFSFSSYAINPCLYGLMNRLIREELSQLLKCIFCLCCGCSHGNRKCRRPCHKLSEDEEDEIDDACLGGAESFYQFLQRTQASDATPPDHTSARKCTLTHVANAGSNEFNSNNISSENHHNGML